MELDKQFLQEILDEAKRQYSIGFSPFICDCIYEARCEVRGNRDYDDSVAHANHLADFIRYEIDNCFSAREYVAKQLGLDSSNFDNDDTEVLNFRDTLFDKLSQHIQEIK